MLINEAKWFADKIQILSTTDLSPCVNIGCQEPVFRRKHAPWIDEVFTKSLTTKGIDIINCDLDAGDDVDVIGDVCSKEIQFIIKKFHPKSAICCNLLEHVVNPTVVSCSIVEMLPESGLIFASCPRSYPYHPNPIDNRYRPNPQELASIFPGCDILFADTVNCGTALDYFKFTESGVFIKILRLFLPFLKPRGWWETAVRIPWFFKPYSASCVVLRKQKKLVRT